MDTCTFSFSLCPGKQALVGCQKAAGTALRSKSSLKPGGLQMVRKTPGAPGGQHSMPAAAGLVRGDGLSTP